MTANFPAPCTIKYRQQPKSGHLSSRGYPTASALWIPNISMFFAASRVARSQPLSAALCGDDDDASHSPTNLILCNKCGDETDLKLRSTP
jgi:hypothetical protein